MIVKSPSDGYVVLVTSGYNNSDGKDARRVFKSKTGHKVTFEDDQGFIQIEDGGGIGTIKIDAKGNKIEITAKQGCGAFQAKDELIILAGEIAITAKRDMTVIEVKGSGEARAETVENDPNQPKKLGWWRRLID